MGGSARRWSGRGTIATTSYLYHFKRGEVSFPIWKNTPITRYEGLRVVDPNPQ
jgi:hypothetical protein